MAKTVEISGVDHTYELLVASASAPVLVFVHGWMLSRQYWQPVIQQLAPHYSCLSYDLRGFGETQMPTSDAARIEETAAIGVSAGRSSFGDQLTTASTSAAPAPSYTPAAYTQDLTLLLQKLNIQTACLVGHSFGGSVALWAAAQAPEQVSGVICVNFGGGIYLKEEFERFRAAGQQLVKFRPRWLSYLPLLDVMLTRLNVARPIARRWGRQRLLDLLSAHPEAAIGALLDSTTEAEVHHLPQLVAHLQQPIHFIAGANDTIMESKYVHHLASFHSSFQFCGNNVTEIPDCGHLAMIEQPQAVANTIRSVLDCISTAAD